MFGYAHNPSSGHGENDIERSLVRGRPFYSQRRGANFVGTDYIITVRTWPEHLFLGRKPEYLFPTATKFEKAI